MRQKVCNTYQKLCMLTVVCIYIFTSAGEVYATPLGWTVDNSSGHSIVTTLSGVSWLSPTATVALLGIGLVGLAGAEKEP